MSVCLNPTAAAAAAASSATTNVSIVDLVTTACQAPTLTEKREILERAYKAVSQPSDLYPILKAYADSWYGQIKSKDDPEYGYRSSGYLSDLSVAIHLQELGLITETYDYKSAATLGCLLTKLEQHPPRLQVVAIDPAVLDSKATGDLRKSLATALIKLSFSLQNWEKYEKELDLHTKLNALTEVLIGSESLEQKRQLAHFKYNRCGFMCMLRGGSLQDRFDSYEPILKLLEEPQVMDAPEAKRLHAQVSNIRGQAVWKLQTPDAAEPYFRTAHAEHKSLVSQFEGEEQWTQKRLLKNVTTNLLHLCNARLKAKEKVEETKLEAKGHLEWLEQFAQEAKTKGDINDYDKDDLLLCMQTYMLMQTLIAQNS